MSRDIYSSHITHVLVSLVALGASLQERASVLNQLRIKPQSAPRWNEAILSQFEAEHPSVSTYSTAPIQLAWYQSQLEYARLIDKRLEGAIK